MSALFDGSTAYLVNATAPITTVPFSIGCWGMFTTAGTSGTLFSLSDTGSTDDWFYVNKDTANKLNIGSQQASGASNAATVTTADVVNSWFYVVGRFISATNRRIAALHAGGLVEHAQNTTSTTPTSIDRVTWGALDRFGGAVTFFPGLLAETWWTNTDIQADGGQLDDNLLRQLAYNGPFSVPTIGRDLIDYNSLRSAVPPIRRSEESYFGKLGPQTWINAGAIAASPHPPLYPNYQKPILPPRPLVMI